MHHLRLFSGDGAVISAVSSPDPAALSRISRVNAETKAGRNLLAVGVIVVTTNLGPSQPVHTLHGHDPHRPDGQMRMAPRPRRPTPARKSHSPTSVKVQAVGGNICTRRSTATAGRRAGRRSTVARLVRSSSSTTSAERRRSKVGAGQQWQDAGWRAGSCAVSASAAYRPHKGAEQVWLRPGQLHDHHLVVEARRALGRPATVVLPAPAGR